MTAQFSLPSSKLTCRVVLPRCCWFSCQHQTIEAVLERGVKLDDLVKGSADLSSQSKLFYTQAKKTNSCCVIS